MTAIYERNGSVLSPEEAFVELELEPRETDDVSEFEAALRSEGIAAIEMPISPEDFARLSEGYEVCINECPEELAATYYQFDGRNGADAGQVRKERKVSPGGVQVSDPKNLFHFVNAARETWQERFAHGPLALRRFLEDGFEIHNAGIAVGKEQAELLQEGSYPGMASRVYFPEGHDRAFTRLIRYDEYEPFDPCGNPVVGDVAKNHFDLGSMTMQLYADAGGFWGNKGGNRAPISERVHFDTEGGQAYAFFGVAHNKLYGQDDRIKKLWHGVDRIAPNIDALDQAIQDGRLKVRHNGNGAKDFVPTDVLPGVVSAGALLVPKRTAVILFIDAPFIDAKATGDDTGSSQDVAELVAAAQVAAESSDY